VKRRALLSTLCLALGGCASTGTAPGGTRTSAERPTNSSTTEEPDTATSTDDTKTTTAGSVAPGEIGVPASETDRPVHGDENAARVVCWPEMADSPLVLAASADGVSLPQGELTFTLGNDTETPFITNFYDWRVRKRVDGEWFSIAPQRVPQPAMVVEPGQSHSWTLSVDNADGNSLDRAEGTDDVSVAGLGGGEYAFTTGGWFETTDHDQQTALAARFSIDGPQVPLEPSAKVTGTTREGDVVTVDRELRTGYNGRKAEYRVTRVERAPDPRDLITEQVLRMRNLRDALAFFQPGVETVRFVEENGVYPPFGIDEKQYVTYEGQVFELTSKELENE
jgi:hypothetical protein